MKRTAPTVSSFGAVDPALLYRMFNPQAPVVVCAKTRRIVAAMSANSCMSLSNSPPVVGLSIRRGSRTNAVVAKSRTFSINWINYTESENPILKLSAESPEKKKKTPDKLKTFGIPYFLVDSVPVLRDVEAFAICNVKRVLRMGDHDLFIATPAKVMASEDFTRDNYWRFEKYIPALYLGSIRMNPLVPFRTP